MKFGKQLEDKITAAGAIGEKIPWLNYACVSPPSSRSSETSDDEGGNQTTTRFFSVADGDAAAPR